MVLVVAFLLNVTETVELKKTPAAEALSFVERTHISLVSVDAVSTHPVSIAGTHG